MKKRNSESKSCASAVSYLYNPLNMHGKLYVRQNNLSDIITICESAVSLCVNRHSAIAGRMFVFLSLYCYCTDMTSI